MISQAPLQCEKPKISHPKTVAFFNRLTSKLAGDEVGAVQLRDIGILLHPGLNSPTEAVFSTLGFQLPVTFATWMCGLPPEALANPDAGVAGIEFILDGRPTGRVVVDRSTNSYHTFDLSAVQQVKIVADNGNGQSIYDWLFIGVM